MKTFFKDIWERIMHLQSTTIGLCIAGGMFYFLVHVLNKKMATFEQVVQILLVMIPIVFGALFRQNNDNQPPNFPPT